MGFGYVSRNQTMWPIETTLRTRFFALLLSGLLCGCASSGTKHPQQAEPAANPLAGLVGRQIVVLPAQLVSTAAPGGSWDVQPQHAPLLKLLDEEIADAFRKRGVRNNWTFADELIRSATRNAGLAGNPLSLPVAGIRRIRPGDTPLPEPLASQIRSLVSLTSARYVIMPLETKIDLSGGQRRGGLRILLIDARTARVTWAGDVDGASTRDATVVGDTFTPFGFRSIARELAGLFAEMVVPG